MGEKCDYTKVKQQTWLDLHGFAWLVCFVGFPDDVLLTKKIQLAGIGVSFFEALGRDWGG